MSDDVLQPVCQVLKSGFITQGPIVEQFEEKLKEYFGNPYVLTLNNGTAGLTLALRLLIEPNEEMKWPGFDFSEDVVLSPALTCFATNAAILANFAKIQWIDSERNQPNISIEDLRNKLNSHTKVVYLVHWGGYPVDLDSIKELQDEHEKKYGYRFQVVEDCAHAFGATYKNSKIGNHGNMCVFSLQAIKQLTTVDGGLIILPNEKLYDRCKLLRWYGIDRDKRNYKGKDLRMENDIIEYGYKFHMNDVNATIGMYNLPHIINHVLPKNRHNYNYLYDHLVGVQGVTLMSDKFNHDTSAWLFTMQIKNKVEFVDYMKSCGIMVSQVHNRNDQHSCVKKFKCQLPNIDQLEKELICIPTGWWLSLEDLDYIIEHIESFSKKNIDTYRTLNL
jgi:dTDP-4-amino-4,6-dideoxygalactose transaminase